MVSDEGSMTKKVKQRLPFYNYNKLYSFNAWYNFVLGSRGTGKTYGAKLRGIKAAINKGEEFIYMRRYKDELAKSRDTFFSDIKHEFPDYDFRINGHYGEMAPVSTRDEKRRPWTTIVYFIPLSTAAHMKSVAYPKVTLIIFDEFIVAKGPTRYMPNEPIAFNEFYNTVDRYMTKTKVLFLANAVSIMNPYFIEWGIEVKPNQEWLRLHNGFICVHFHDSKEFQSAVLSTPFGEFIAKTDYANYAVNNQFADNNLELIEKKTADAEYYFTIETGRGTFSVWINWKEDLWYMQKKRPGNERIFTLVPENMSDDKTLLVYSDPLLSRLRTKFRKGMLLFDSPTVRNAFTEVFRR
jgi:hypothetical protein